MLVRRCVAAWRPGRAACSTGAAGIKSVLIYGDSNTWGYDPNSSSSRQSNHRHPHPLRWTSITQALLGPGFHIIPEGLNNRTTVYSDTISTEGEYDCNGRATLSATLHSHKPLDVIALALGTNDLKEKFSATPRDIAIGVRILVKDVQNMAHLGHFNGVLHAPPKVLVLGPPLVHLTALSKLWGFPDDLAIRAKKLSALLAVLSRELSVDYLDLGARCGQPVGRGRHSLRAQRPEQDSGGRGQ